jgi:hypothetical protein
MSTESTIMSMSAAPESKPNNDKPTISDSTCFKCRSRLDFDCDKLVDDHLYCHKCVVELANQVVKK